MKILHSLSAHFATRKYIGDRTRKSLSRIEIQIAGLISTIRNHVTQEEMNMDEIRNRFAAADAKMDQAMSIQAEGFEEIASDIRSMAQELTGSFVGGLTATEAEAWCQKFEAQADRVLAKATELRTLGTDTVSREDRDVTTQDPSPNDTDPTPVEGEQPPIDGEDLDPDFNTDPDEDL